MNDEIFNLLLQQEDVTWKSLLHDLVEAEGMDPWNINVTQLTHRYIEVIKEMKDHDLRISGKIILAAAILLKIKSSHLEDDISKLDELINQTENDEDFEDDLFETLTKSPRDRQQYTLIPRTPQPRERKVSINDLVEALQRTINAKKRVLQQQKPTKFIMPERTTDIMEVIRDVYHKITYYSKKDQTPTVTFSRLLPAKPSREDKVFTFLPLLHLEHQQKISTDQPEAFGEIDVKMLKEKSPT